jgi:hypothetical protein
MVLAACIGIYYIYKRYRSKCRSKSQTRTTNIHTPVTQDISTIYGQVPIPSTTQPVAFYALPRQT